jgi:type IVB pilus formation R64 PilN family outer membrane protein
MTLPLSPLKYTLAFAVLFAVMTLPSCATRNESRDDVNLMAQRADQNLAAINPQKDIVSSLTEDSSPWFGNTAIPATTGETLPANLEKDNALVLTFEKPLNIDQVAGRIEAATGLRVMVDHVTSGSATGGGGSSVPNLPGSSNSSADSTAFLPSDGQEVAGSRTVWQGKLSHLLDEVADHFDAEWKYSNGTLHISQQIVRTFMLHALAGTTDVGGSVKTTDTNNGGLPQQSVDSTSKLVVWDEIQKAIETIVGGKARASYSPATGTITVAGSPSSVNAVETYLKMQNKLRLRRVAIEAKVLTVQLSKTYDNNFDLNLVLRNNLTGRAFQFSSVAATGTDVGRTVSAGILSAPATDAAIGTSQAVISALSAVATRVSVEYSGSLVTLSDQPAPLQVATKRSYVARVSGSSSDTTSSTSLEPGTLDIGLSMNLMPRVIEQDRIMLRIAMGITDLVQLREFTSGSGNGASTIQLPEVDSTGFLQNAVLRSGETLVLAGFERKNANDTQTGTGTPSNWLLGGGENFGQGREIRVLLITASVLPEEPVNVVNP